MGDRISELDEIAVVPDVADYIAIVDESESPDKTKRITVLNFLKAKLETWSFAISDNTTALTTGTKFTWYTPYAITLTDIQASVLTAPTGSIIIIDVHEAGTTIMTTDKLDIEATEFHTNDATDQPALTDTALAAGAKIEFIIDQVGSTIAGAGAIVYLLGFKT